MLQKNLILETPRLSWLRLFSTLLLCGLASTICSACATPAPPPLPVIVEARPACQHPPRPEYAAIGAEMADTEKWATLLDNLARLRAYVGELETSLTCYEETTAPKEPEPERPP